MARKTGQDADTQAQSPPAGQAAPRPARSRRTVQELLSLTQARGVRLPRHRGAGDDRMQMRSFNLRTGTVERLKATVRLIQARSYGSELAETAPQTMNAAADEALNAWCSYYEDLLNGGKEAPRITRLPAGPSPEGAVRGAQKRAAARQAAKH